MLHVIGESSIFFIAGALPLDRSDNSLNKYKNIRGHWIHLTPARDLIDENGQIGKGGKEVLSRLETESNISSIILTFGAIDIRVDLIKRAIESQCNPLEIINEISQRLLSFATHLRGFYEVPIFILSPNPDSPNFAGINPSFPTIGSERERNFYTYKLGLELEKNVAKNSQIFILNLFQDLVDPVLNIEKTMYADAFHVGYRGLKIFVHKFNDLIAQSNLQLPNYWDYDELRYSNKPVKKDISKKCKIYKISSQFSEQLSLYPISPSQEFIFHTNLEKNPYVIIDIGYVSPLAELVFENRLGYEDRLQNLRIGISKVEYSFETIYEHPGTFGADGNVLIVDMNPYLGKVKFIKLELNSENYFHLKSLKIIENSFLEED